jgi:hypothetical protein
VTDTAAEGNAARTGTVLMNRWSRMERIDGAMAKIREEV